MRVEGKKTDRRQQLCRRPFGFFDTDNPVRPYYG